MPFPSIREVKTLWEYIDYDNTLLKTFLPGDVVQISVQVKTTRGMHNIRRDAWGGHSHSFKKWGSQIQPTGSTKAKILKFKKQWQDFQQERLRERRQQAMQQTPPTAPLAPARGHTISQHPCQFPYFLREPFRRRPSQTVPSTSTGNYTPSPVAESLSQMAQLAAGMLPLHQQAPVSMPLALRPGTPRPMPEATAPKATTGTVSLLHTSPITSEDEVPALVDSKDPGADQPIDLTIKQEPKEEKTEVQSPPIAQPPYAENKEGFVPHIKEMSSISLSVFNSMDKDGMPEVSHVVVKENPRSPTPTRMEEEIDTSPPAMKRTQVKICLQPQPVDPEITVM